MSAAEGGADAVAGPAPLRVGLLGAGASAREIHGPAFAAAAGAELVAIASRGVERARALAADLGVAVVHETPETLLADPAVDAVVICTPPHTHRPYAEAAVAAGKHVLLEKPVAHTPADVAALRALAESTPVVVDVVRNERFMAQHVAVRELLAAGAIGELVAVQIFTATEGPDTWTGGAAWPHEPAQSGGGALLDLGVHKVDLAGWITGRPVVSVGPAQLSTPGHDGSPVEWLGALTFTLSGGVAGTLVASWVGPPDEMELHAMGSAGTLSAYGTTGEIVVRAAGGEQRSSHPAPWGPDDASPGATAAAFVAACATPAAERVVDPLWDDGTRWILDSYGATA